MLRGRVDELRRGAKLMLVQVIRFLCLALIFYVVEGIAKNIYMEKIKSMDL